VNRTPSTARRVVLVALSVVVVAIVVWFAIPVATGVVSTYSFRGDRAQAAWQQITPSWGDAKQCGTCHTTERDRLTTAHHDGIGCQSCHGAQAKHESDPIGGTKTPTDTVCLKCHTKVDGQPAYFNAVVAKDHYTSTCLSCHDPHTTKANQPPVIGHTTENIPTCITCHGPDKFKARAVRHPSTSTNDAFCLSCHLPGRGPASTTTPGANNA